MLYGTFYIHVLYVYLNQSLCAILMCLRSINNTAKTIVRVPWCLYGHIDKNKSSRSMPTVSSWIFAPKLRFVGNGGKTRRRPETGNVSFVLYCMSPQTSNHYPITQTHNESIILGNQSIILINHSYLSKSIKYNQQVNQSINKPHNQWYQWIN